MLEEVLNSQNYSFKPWAILMLISSMLALILGPFVYSKNRKAILNTIFCLFCLSLSSTLICMIFVMASRNDNVVIFWDRLVYISQAFMFSFLYHFGFAFCKIRTGWQRQFLKLVYLLLAAFCLILIFYPDYFIKGVYRYAWGAHAKAAFFHHIFTLWTLIIAILFLFNIYIRFIKTSLAVEKQQVKYIFIAFFILWFASGAYLTAYGVGVAYPFAFFPPTIFVSIVAFTIIRYRLMEIETVIHKTVLWLATSVLVFIPISLLLLLLWPWLKNLSPWASAAVIVISFFGFLWYYHRIQPRIDHFFQRRRFDPYQVLFRVVSKVSSQEELEDAVTTLTQELKTYLYSRNLVAYIQDERTGEYKLAGEKGYEEAK